jgi:hypothetical protein
MPLDHLALRFSRNAEADEAMAVYGGVRYRSKRHAQWAVFFDALGLEHAYQSRSFQLGRGVSFTPDFWLPELNAWLMVGPADFIIRNADHPDRWKIELFSRMHPDFRVWVANGVPRPGEWHIEQLGVMQVKYGMLLADAAEPAHRIWICGANDEQAAKIVFDAIEIGTGRSAPAPGAYPADPNTSGLMRMAYGQVEHFQADSWSSLGAIAGQIAGGRRSSAGVSPL